MKRQIRLSYIQKSIKLHLVLWMLLPLWVVMIQCRISPENKNNDRKNPPVDSLEYYNDLISKNSMNVEALIERARILSEQNSYGAALKDLEAVLRIDSLQLGIYIVKSQVEMDYFRSLESVRTLQKAESIWPNSFLIKENLAQTHLILKQYNRATEKSNQALKINPASARPYLYLGMIAKETQDTATAIQHLQQAVQNDADLLDAWIELARIQTKINPAEAAQYFESALQIAPDDVLIWHAYAMYWQNRDSLEQAKTSYNQIIQLDSGYIEAYYNKALIVMDQDSFQRAIPLWNDFIRRSPESAKGYYYRGICYELTQQYQPALDDYVNAKSLDPELTNIDNAIQSMETKMQNTVE